MKRSALVAVMLIAPTLALVRAVVRYNQQQAAMAQIFGTEEEREAAAARVIANAHNALDAGAATGVQETEEGCLTKGFERERSGPRQYAELMHFLEGCLRVARPTPGFCENVPPYRATMSAEEEQRSQAYQQATCEKEGLDDRDCRASVRMVQLHCHPLR